MRLALFFALLPTFVLAQSAAPRPADLGTVTGHIICADTRSPARFAEINLISDKTKQSVTFPSIETDMDGAYVIRNVPPGLYYLIVALPGYITPFYSFNHLDFHSGSPEIEQRIQQELQMVTVAPHSTTKADATLRVGASISGTVRYDDGSPAGNIEVSPLRRNAKAQFLHSYGRSSTTDGQGKFKIESLSPGEYIVVATLKSTEMWTQKALTPDGKPADTLSQRTFSLPVYLGDVFRQHDATTIKLDDGEQSSGADITIPVTQLHTVSGTLTAKDGHPINSGKIELLYPDTREVLNSVEPADDGTFHFTYAPEGSYVLKVERAQDTTRYHVPDGPNGYRIDIHPEHTYETVEQPLLVHTDIQSLNLIVPDRPTPTSASKSPTSR